MKTKLVLIILLFASGLIFGQEWTVTEIGICPNDKTYGICVGNGHNDGTNRVYVSTRGEATDGAIYEWTYSGTSWEMTATVGTSLTNLVTLSIGNGRNDGILRLYVAEWGGTTSNIYEYTWNGASWDRVTLDSPTKPMLSILVGDAHGDGVNRVYVAGWIIQREYQWNGSGWDFIDISTAHGTEGPVFFGNGRNDDVLRYYTPGNHVKEFTWDGSSWSDSTSASASNGWPETVVITDGRNDGLQRIYTQDNSGIHEITRNGEAWDAQQIYSRTGRSFLFAAQTKSDEKYYLYNTSIALPFMELGYNSGSGQYDATTIDAATGATALIDVGVGRNDNVVRIYTPGYASGKIYEITNQDPLVLGSTDIEQEDSNIEISFNSNSNILYLSNLESSAAKLSIYDMSGKVVLVAGLNRYNSEVSLGKLASGVYLISIGSNGKTQTKKIYIK